MEFKIIEYDTVEYIEMVELRNTVLLEPIGMPYFEDVFVQDEESIFIGCYDNGELIACCVLTELDDNLVQLRQMAVAEEFHHTRVGTKLIVFAEKIAKEYDFKKITLHARRVVEGFYLKNGYNSEGEEFVEAGIAHVIMTKSI